MKLFILITSTIATLLCGCQKQSISDETTRRIQALEAEVAELKSSAAKPAEKDKDDAPTVEQAQSVLANAFKITHGRSGPDNVQVFDAIKSNGLALVESGVRKYQMELDGKIRFLDGITELGVDTRTMQIHAAPQGAVLPVSFVVIFTRKEKGWEGERSGTVTIRKGDVKYYSNP